MKLKLPRFPRRAPAVDTPEGRRLYPHQYVGAPSAFGLEQGPCHIERKWGGGYIIRDPRGRRWTVAKGDVEPR